MCGHLNVSSYFHHYLNLSAWVLSTGYTQAFFNTLCELVAIVASCGINAGDDSEADKEDCDKSIIADRHNQDKTGHNNPPEQQPEPVLSNLILKKNFDRQ
jgi:hypothetical protein